jgi:hypothetical protein
MKTLQQLFGTSLLVLAICFSTYAGDISGPVGAPAPTNSTIETAKPVFGAPTSSTAEDTDLSPLALVADLLFGVLPLY